MVWLKMELLWTLFLLLVVCGLVCSSRPDPLCASKHCPRDSDCRVVYRCNGPQSCSLQAECIARPSHSPYNLCAIGHVILTNQGAGFTDLGCGTKHPCPDGAYCNTELMDTYSRCCRSDPANPVKPGECPVNTYTNDDFCLDTCNNDGDCRDPSMKCCPFGCNRDCVPAQPLDPCKTKVCPEGTYCYPASSGACPGPGPCPLPGDCVSGKVKVPPTHVTITEPPVAAVAAAVNNTGNTATATATTAAATVFFQTVLAVVLPLFAASFWS